MSTGLRGLKPKFRPWAEALLRAAKDQDHRFVITSAKRSSTEQARLYKAFLAGRSKLTALPPGRSLHEKGLAIDLARPGVDPMADELLPVLGALWRSWGGKWGGASDPVHFQVPT